MKTVDPSRSSLAAIVAGIPADVPIVMLNMLRFRDRAAYPAESGHAACSGREAYARYAEVVLRLVVDAGGALVWRGTAHGALIAPPDESWDEVFLVRYPRLAAFLEMIGSDAYAAVAVHRTAALDDSRLIATREGGGDVNPRESSA